MVTNSLNMNGHVPLGPGDSIEVQLNQALDSVQWMSNDLRDSWSYVHSYEEGNSVMLKYEDIVEELEHLPGTTLEGNHTLSMRGLQGTTSSPLISIDIMLGENTGPVDTSPESSNVVLYGSIIAAIMLAIILLAVILKGDYKNEMALNNADEEGPVDAEIIE